MLTKESLGQLDNEAADMRRMAAWCLGTAVQNNVQAQERVRCAE